MPPPGACCRLQHRRLAGKFCTGAKLLSWTVSFAGTALVEELDKLLMVQLRDGRKIMGILRCLSMTGSSDICIVYNSRQATTRKHCAV